MTTVIYEHLYSD